MQNKHCTRKAGGASISIHCRSRDINSAWLAFLPFRGTALMPSTPPKLYSISDYSASLSPQNRALHPTERSTTGRELDASRLTPIGSRSPTIAYSLIGRPTIAARCGELLLAAGGPRQSASSCLVKPSWASSYALLILPQQSRAVARSRPCSVLRFTQELWCRGPIRFTVRTIATRFGNSGTSRLDHGTGSKCRSRCRSLTRF